MAWYEYLIGSKRSEPALASTWSDGADLAKVTLSDFYGLDTKYLPLTRTEAMGIPAVAKARNLIVSSIANAPLLALNAEGPLAVQPAWLYRTDTAVTPYARMAWTIDSLIFRGVALWYVERGAIGQITTANYVPDKDWRISNGHVQIDDRDVPEENYILFDHISGGLLNEATRTLRQAIDIENTVASRVQNPIPIVTLQHAAGSSREDMLEQEEIDRLTGSWRKARQDPNGALGYVPAGLEMVTHGDADAQVFVEARNAIRTDVGSFVNIPTAMLDGTVAMASLTYVTSEGNRNRFYDEAIPFWADSIAARLSMDDCIPRGSRVRFNFAEKSAPTPTPTGIPEED